MATAGSTPPKDRAVPATYALPCEISAMQVVAIDDGHAQCGPLIRLPLGAELREFGEGVDDRTLRVRCDGSFYVIFKEDVDDAN